MTKDKQKEIDIVKFVNSTLKWVVGIFITVALGVGSDIIYRSYKMGRMEANMENLTKSNIEIKEEIKDINKKIVTEGKEQNSDFSKKIEEIEKNITSLEFFLSREFGYEKNIRGPLSFSPDIKTIDWNFSKVYGN